MSASTVRAFLKDLLTEELPSDWKIIPHQVTPATIDRTTVVLTQGRIAPLPEAPFSQLAVDVTVTVISPYADESRAETDLDDSVLEVAHALHGHPQINFIEASKTSASNNNLAWDLRVQVITQAQE